MLRGQAKVDPRQGFSGSGSQDKSKPETEPKNGNHFGIDRCDSRSFCGRSSETNLAIREQQQKAKPRQALLGLGITSSKHPHPYEERQSFTNLVPLPTPVESTRSDLFIRSFGVVGIK
jgi:hypothetical protein